MSLAAVALPPEEIAVAKLEAQCEQSYRELRYFVYYAFNVLEPGRELVWNWHLSVLCDELQRWTRPLWDPQAPDPPVEDRVLVVCVPPKSLKTNIASICLKAWLWVRQPWLFFHGIGNKEDLEKDNNRKLMQLILSSWYQQLVRYAHIRAGGSADDQLPWGLSEQQAEKVNFVNTQSGGSIAFGVDSSYTGRGSDLQTWDDPYDAKEATRGSPDQVAKKMAVPVNDYDNAAAARYNIPLRWLRLVVMQRLDPNDLAGVLIRRGVKAIVFPMEFDPEFPADHGGVHPNDPRRVAGELLMPKRIPPALWADMKRAAEDSVDGTRHLDAQQNQRTRSKEGTLFKADQFERRFPGDPLFLIVDEVIIFVDCSFKSGKDTSHVVLEAWGRRGKAWFALLDQVRDQMDYVSTVRVLLDFRKKWAMRCKRVVLEDKANGPAVISLLQHEVPGIQPWNPGTKSKYERAEIGSAPPLQAGQVFFPEDIYAPWLKGYVGRHVQFDGSGSVPDDEIDTTSMALLYMAGESESPLDRLKRRHPANLVGVR